MNIGTVDAELRGADSYAPKELVGSKGREEEEVVDANAPKTITLRDYYKEKGIKSAL